MKQKAARIFRKILWGTAGLIAVIGTINGAVWAFKALGVSSHVRVVASDAQDWIGHPFDSLQTKVDALARALDDNERLRLENAHLKLRVESLHFDCQQKKAQTSTHSFEKKLHAETGSRVGRTLASVAYRIPEQLSPEQLYVLGVSYFKGGENEKAATILTFLTNLDGVSKYKNPRDWLMTGVAWYRLDNFEAADPYLDKVIRAENAGHESQSYHAQALLWKALVAERTGKKMKSQFWMRELLDHHPYSPEAAWVNGRAKARAPAAAAEHHAAKPAEHHAAKPAEHHEEHHAAKPEHKAEEHGHH